MSRYNNLLEWRKKNGSWNKGLSREDPRMIKIIDSRKNRDVPWNSIETNSNRENWMIFFKTLLNSKTKRFIYSNILK